MYWSPQKYKTQYIQHLTQWTHLHAKITLQKGSVMISNGRQQLKTFGLFKMCNV